MTPKIRQSIYYLGALVAPVLGLLLLWGGIEAGTADQLQAIVGALVALLGAPLGVAAKKTAEQRRDGTLEPTDPLTKVSQGIEEIQQTRKDALGIEGIMKGMLVDALDRSPLGPLAEELLK